MLTAHIPSGYLIANTLPLRTLPTAGSISIAVIGSLFPDIDMVVFFLIDHGSFHHRYYWTHIPAFWLAAFAISLVVFAALEKWRWVTVSRNALALFFCGVSGHLLVDTWSGPVLWLYPLTTTPFELVEVPATQSHWVLSYFLHWSFAAEIALWLGAAATFVTVQKQKRRPEGSTSRGHKFD